MSTILPTRQPIHRFPSAIEGKLRRVRWRHAGLVSLAALATAASVLMVLMVVSMTIDWMFPFAPSPLRIGLTSLTLLITMATAICLLIGPLRRSLHWHHAANAVDVGVPELEERWSTVASLTAQNRSPRSASEQAMAAQVTSEAIAMERIVQPRWIAPPISLRPALQAALMGGGLFALLFVVSPRHVSVLLQRFWSPTQNITATELTGLTGDPFVPRGDAIELITQVSGLVPDSATMSVMHADGSTQDYRLTAGTASPETPPEASPNAWTQTIRVNDDLSYRVRAGDAQTAWRQLHAIDFPEIDQLEFTVEFPPYIHRETIQLDRLPRRVKVPHGSTLRLAIKPFETLKQLTISLVDPERPPSAGGAELATNEMTARELSPENDGWYRLELPLINDLLLRPTLLSHHDLTNQRRLFSRIDVVEDKAPVARIITPNDEIAVAEDESIEIEFEAHDDYGIEMAELVIYDESQKDADGNAKVLAVQPIELGEQAHQKNLMGKTHLDLKELGIREGRQISYAVRVTDNRKLQLSDDSDASPRDDQTRPAPERSEHADTDNETKANAKTLDVPQNKLTDTASTLQQPAESRSELANEGSTENEKSNKLMMNATSVAKSETADAKTSEQAASSKPTKPDKSAESNPDKNIANRAVDQLNISTPAIRQPAPVPSMDTGPAMLTGQRSRTGQNTLTGRRRLKITDKLSAVADAVADPKDRLDDENRIRESVVQIDVMLAEIEAGLRKLVDHKIADSDRSEQFRRLDTGLGNVENFVADLRAQTKENPHEFVGLQMVDITRSHVTPARDHVFAGGQRPGSSDVDATMGLQHIVRARELLAALLKRYERVNQEQDLQEGMGEAVTMYEVYIKKRRQLMREARQNQNPLDRKMGIIEVDEAYLERLAEVLTLRREMMDEFAQMLGDDPRLLSRYMELVKRRQKSLRNELTDISQRQYDLTEEAMSWLQIDDTQRPELWTIIAELRIHSADDLAKNAAELAERVEKQLPLEIDAELATAALVIRQAKQIASAARTISFDAGKLATEPGEVTDTASLRGNARSLIDHCERMFSLLDQLQLEHTRNEAIEVYVESRIQETRVVADLAAVWSDLSNSLTRGSYAGLVQTDQHRLAVSTQLLRVEMLDMEADLTAQFQRVVNSDLPGEIKDRIRTLHRLMETITFNQIAACIRSGNDDLESANEQQQLCTERLTEAEKLLDSIRRAVVNRLDEYDPPDPNIGDLRDPTLDEFLARLEREPNIAAQLGIPNRRTNLRIRADMLLWQESKNGTLAASQIAAAGRAREAMKMPKPKQGRPNSEAEQAKDMSKAEQEQREQAKQAQEQLAKTLNEIEKQRQQGSPSAAAQKRLDEMAKKIEQLMQPDSEDNSAEREWQRIVHADQAKEWVQGIAAGESMPDEQWNRLLSTLDEGLWQVQGSRAPEAYRKAIEQYQNQIRGLMPGIDEN